MVDFSEVVQAVNGLCTSLEGLVSALDRERVAADSDGGSTEPLPRPFDHTDPHDNSVRFGETADGTFYVHTEDAHRVYLDQYTVNCLAQYLDGYRTDLSGGTTICEEMQSHAGPCSGDADDIGVVLDTDLSGARAGTQYHGGPCSLSTDGTGWPCCTGQLPSASRVYCTLCGHEPHGAVGCGEGGRGVHRCQCRGGA